MILVASTCHRVFPPSSCVRVSSSALIPDFGAGDLWPPIGFPDPLHKKWNSKKAPWISHWISPCSTKIKSRIRKQNYNLNGLFTSIRPLETFTPCLQQFGLLSTRNFHSPPRAIGLLFGLGPPGREKPWEGLNTTKTREPIGIPCLEMEHSMVFLGTWIYMKSGMSDIPINIGMSVQNNHCRFDLWSSLIAAKLYYL